jgi:hypothetical protein
MTALNFPDSPTDGEEFSGYVWSDSDNVWNRLPEAPGINLANLGDVDITPAAGDSLIYDGNSWLNTPQKNRNLLYNGAMQVHQRGTSATDITTEGYYTADRWEIANASMGVWTQTVENDAPTGSGFKKSLKMLCTTADATPDASDDVRLNCRLEGQDLQSIKKGTSAAEQLTFSFWVKSNVTGTYVLNLVDVDNTRHVSAYYTINAENTWEKKVITFPADMTGAFDNDNSQSLLIIWRLGAGTDRTSGTLRTTWTPTVSADFAVGQVNLAAATSNYWQITGVQLEVGPVATPFEFKPFGQELAECQRYYYRATADVGFAQFGYSTARGSAQPTLSDGIIPAPVTMRVAPTAVDFSNLLISLAAGGSNSAVTSAAINTGSNTRFLPNVTFTTAGNLGAIGATMQVLANNSTSAFIGLNAEL